MEREISLYTKVLHIGIGLFAVTVVSKELVLGANQGNVSPKTCTNVGTFRVSFGKSFEACTEECQRRQRCEIVMYKHGINECSLKDFINITGLKEEEPICLFTNINDLERTGLGPCGKNSCEITETCVTSSTDPNRFECVKSECSKPQVIVNASVFSKLHGIGYRNGYKCDPTFVGNGDPFITCKNDSTWTSTNFKCVGTGREPASDLESKKDFDFEIADLISVVGEEGVAGTKLNFACRPGYQGLGPRASSVLQENGEWSPDVVQCCNENITKEIWGHICIETFNGSFATTFSDTWRLCKEKGGGMRGLTQNLAEHVFKNEGYLWLLTNIRKDAFHSELQKCFKRNDAYDILENFSSYTFVGLVREIKSRNLTGHPTCNSQRWWAPNEPNGGDAAQCVAFRNGTYDMFDFNCSSFVFPGRADFGFICSFGLPDISGMQ